MEKPDYNYGLNYGPSHDSFYYSIFGHSANEKIYSFYYNFSEKYFQKLFGESKKIFDYDNGFDILEKNVKSFLESLCGFGLHSFKIAINIINSYTYHFFNLQQRVVGYICLNKSSNTITLIFDTPNKEMFKTFAEKVQQQEKLTSDKNSNISILDKDEYGGIVLRNIPKFDFKQFNDISVQFGNDFSGHHSKILNLFEQEKNGIFLFHGDPGTGKSTYIYYLSSLFEHTRFIFVSTSVIGCLDQPGFIDIILENPGSVFIFEDSELILAEGGQIRSTLSSAVLNLTDGMLGKSCKIRVVCTFNTNLDNIDKAFLRKGRMLYKHEFSPLSANEANRLANELGFDVKFDKSMIAADVFNYSIENNSHEIKERAIGFTGS